jgi:hypothetical protein
MGQARPATLRAAVGMDFAGLGDVANEPQDMDTAGQATGSINSGTVGAKETPA